MIARKKQRGINNAQSDGRLPEQMETGFHEINEGLFSDSAFEQATEDAVRFDADMLKRAPLRVRLILKGLVNGADAAQVNKTLLEQGCPTLYARSYREAVLIYALNQHLSLPQYQALQRQCDALREHASSKDIPPKSVTLHWLRQYVTKYSNTEGTRLVTGTLTRQLADSLGEVESDEALLQILNENIAAFSEVREKTRYYFCKYLLYYLDNRVEDYFNAKRTKVGIPFAEEQIRTLFRGISYLKRHKSEEEGKLRTVLEEAPISLGGVFEDFSYFFFYYNVQPWTDLLGEAYGDDLAQIPTYLKEKYLRAVRCPSRPDLDQAVAQMMRRQEAEAEQATSTERCGETALRKYFRGQLDMDRGTFLCFLLFFSATSQIPAGQQLEERRVNEILVNCGFPMLQSDQPFDAFVCRFLGYDSLDAAWDYVMEEVNRAVMRGEDSFLYRSYRRSDNYYRQLEPLNP